jgi:PII-like signaling protein
MLTDGKLLRIYIAESARIREKPAYKFLLDYFIKKGFSGCTVFRGMAGFGHENRIRTVDVLQLSLDLPVVIDVVDTEEKILSVLPEIERMVEHGEVTVQDVRFCGKSLRQSPESSSEI